jgi:hypothetical protein
MTRVLAAGGFRRPVASALLGAGLAIMLAIPVAAPAADHGDTALLRSLQRHDARITDLYAFIRNEKLVLAICLDPTVAPGVSNYVFLEDLSVRILLDIDSEITFDDPDDLATLGGTIVAPDKIEEDITFKVRFDKRHKPSLSISGLPGRVAKEVDLFVGLRDDPFIRGPRIGHNVAAIVLQLPVDEVLETHGTMLVWAVSKVPDIHGPQADLAGRGLRNQFPENEPMNLLHPRHHLQQLGLIPDVLIFDTSHEAAFPNGRELADDVVDLVGDPRPLRNDEPFPDENDVPFLDQFPYLPPPQ